MGPSAVDGDYFFNGLVRKRVRCRLSDSGAGLFTILVFGTIHAQEIGKSIGFALLIRHSFGLVRWAFGLSFDYLPRS